MGKLDENVTSTEMKSKVERQKTIAYKSLYRRLPPPSPSFPHRGSQLIYSLLVVGDIVAYIRLDFPGVTASNKYVVVIKRDCPGEPTFFKLL